MTILGIKYDIKIKGHPLWENMRLTGDYLEKLSGEKMIWSDENPSKKDLSDVKFVFAWSRAAPHQFAIVPKDTPIISYSVDPRLTFSDNDRYQDWFWIQRSKAFTVSCTYPYILGRPIHFLENPAFPEKFRTENWTRNMIATMNSYGGRKTRIVDFLDMVEHPVDIVGVGWTDFEHENISKPDKSTHTKWKPLNDLGYKFTLEVCPRFYDFLQETSIYWSDRIPMAAQEGMFVVTNNQATIRSGLPHVISWKNYLTGNYCTEWEQIEKAREQLDPNRIFQTLLRKIDSWINEPEVFW